MTVPRPCRACDSIPCDCETDDSSGVPAFLTTGGPVFAPNPKTLMGLRKLPILSVVPPASLLYEAMAMRYGAYEAPRADGTKGYGPFNWRDQPVEMMTYIDAAFRHLMAVVDGEDVDPSTGVPHIAHAKAGLGILADALENGKLIDNRPRVRNNVAAKLIAKETRK